jgi:hypothetical protein
MEVRITFRSEVYIKGDTLEEIKKKWLDLPLYSGEALEETYAEYVDLVSVEDTKTYEDLTFKWKEDVES